MQASVESGGGAFRIENPLSSLTLKELKAVRSCRVLRPTRSAIDDADAFLSDLELSEDVGAARRWVWA